MENFEKCTVDMLGGPCSQHVTENTSRLIQLQSAMIYAIGKIYAQDGVFEKLCIWLS